MQELGELWAKYKNGDKSILGTDGDTPTPKTSQAGISTFALLGLIGAGVWFFLKGKKK